MKLKVKAILKLRSEFDYGTFTGVLFWALHQPHLGVGAICGTWGFSPQPFVLASLLTAFGKIRTLSPKVPFPMQDMLVLGSGGIRVFSGVGAGIGVM